MSTNRNTTAVAVAIGVVGKWKETYKWVPIFGAITAIAMAFSVGANNIPASFSSPVGSGALTLLQASIAACVIYIPGAAFASSTTVNALFSDFIKENQPNEGFLMWSMVVVLITATLWLVLATCLELPVSSQQSIQGALLGTMLVTKGFSFIPMWNKFIPNFAIVDKWATIAAVALATLIGALLSLVVMVPLARERFVKSPHFKTVKRKISLEQQSREIQDQTCVTKSDDNEKFEEALRDFMQLRVLDTVYEEDERSWASPETITESIQVQSFSQDITGQSTPFKQLLESTPNRLVQSKNFQNIEKSTARENASKFVRGFVKSKIFPVIEYDRHTLIRHALAEKFDELEDFFGFPLLLASCIFALIQSASEVAAVVSPFGAILDVFMHRAKYSGNGEDVGSLYVHWWFRAIGGLSASIGFFLWGWHLNKCLGGKLTYISNSRGMASQFSTVATMIMLTRLKLPVSSVHAFVGSLVGVGIADEPRNVNWKLLLKFLCGWVMTILFCCSVAYGMYSFSIHSPAYVVP
ncbi:hypothetical protein F0562_018152 [Nyssa sinensis]|uniref:Phosphate transporter n=1 Tax=Nyssa sinensis TaxID=561372 RepID=A0A5J4ZCT1_9ASTE|nr:hypothetical protein F0562_018152 [Nyssa sinensis]